MTTTTTLLEEDDRHIGLLVLVDGIRQGWTDNAELVGIDTGAGHDVRLGLKRENLTCELSINLRDGQWLDSPATIVIEDYSDDDELATLFAQASAAEQLGDVPIGEGLPVHPTTDLTGRPDLDEMCIGLETIGVNGARHQYPVPPGFDVGLEHSITVPSLGIDGAPVTASPIVWTNRRCAIYVMFRDHVDDPLGTDVGASWRPFSEARRIWCGTMRGAARIDARRWTFELDGPGSLLKKSLGASFTQTPSKAIGEFTLSDVEGAATNGISCALSTDSATYGQRLFVTTLTATTREGLIAEIQAEITATAAALGADPDTWADSTGYSVRMDDEGRVQIAMSDSDTGPGLLELILHRSVWSFLGYDVEQQNALYPDPDDPHAVEFWPAITSDGPDEGADDDTIGPGPDYWCGRFWTGQASWPNAANNDGAARTYAPIYSGGATVLLAGLNEGAGQVVRLELSAGLGGGTSVAHPGQLAWPIASLPDAGNSPIEIDGTPCDRCGVWAFRGKRRFDGTSEVFEETWIGLACWTNGSAQQDGLVANDSIIVTRWLDRRMFGFTSTKGGQAGGDWLARADADDDLLIYARPVIMLGYQQELDRAHVVLQRLLYSTGSADAWSAPENGDPAPEFTAGDNEPAGDRTVAFDAEIADLGLAVPGDWIASPESFQAVVDRIEADAILNVKVGVDPGYQAEDVIRSLMQPAGMAWHFRDGQLGVWVPSDPLTFADVTVQLNRSVRGRGDAPQDRAWQPVDKWKVDRDWQPVERKVAVRSTYEAPDGQYRYRTGDITMQILAHATRGGAPGLIESITRQSRWLARPHFLVRGWPVQMLRPGLDCWPGTIARLTDPRIFDPAGGYGVENRIAIVTRTRRAFRQKGGEMLLDLLVLGTRTATPKLHAIIGQSIGFDTGTSRLYMRDNWNDLAGAPVDASLFVEPTYSGVVAYGGNAVVECWQHDGDALAVTLTGTVTSVVTTPGSSYLQLASPSGTYYRDRHCWVVLRRSTTANAAWVDANFAPISDDTGQWVDVTTPTDGDKWED